MEKSVTPPESLKYYDVWNFAKLDKSYGQDYPGRIPGQIVENALWYFTKPLDIVCDPLRPIPNRKDENRLTDT